MKRPYIGVISIKVTLWVSTVVIAIVALHIYIMRPERRFMEQKMRDSERIAEIIESHLLAEMAAGEPDNIQKHMELLPHNAGIYSVEIVNSEMRVRFSSDSTRVGKIVDPARDTPCVHCHSLSDRPPRTVYDAEGVGRIFAVDHVLRNESECKRCHQDRGPLLGNILVQVSLTDHDLIALSARRRLVTVGGVLLVLMLVAMGASIYWLVGRPAMRLLAKMDRVRRGDFDVGPPDSSKDEFGALERGFHIMVQRLQGVYGEMDAKIRERTQSLYEAQAQVMHQDKLANIGQLAAGVAHEIGNPLTAVDSMVQLMAIENEDKEIRDKATMIRGQIDRISEIVHGMSDMSRPLSLDVEYVDVNAVMGSVLTLVHYDARFKSVTVETDFDESLPMVEIVEDRLFGAFLNLAMNAADAMPGGGTLTIRTRRIVDSETVEITFRDTGHGVDAENLERIFDPYFTTKAQGRGTGLGLPMCKTFFEEIGGTLDFVSERGAGTTFTIRIPVDRGRKAKGDS